MMNRISFYALGVFVAALLAGQGMYARNPEKPFSPEGVYLNKSVTADPNTPNKYTIDLEAYVTGRQTTVFTVSFEPADIILVLDTSGSMDDPFVGSTSRMAALKQAVNGFITDVGKKAVENNIKHKIGIIEFANSDYTVSNLVDLSSQSNVDQLKSKVSNLTSGGGTYAEEGFEAAYDMMQNRSEKTYVDKDGQTKQRNQIVIFFTDGLPGDQDVDDDVFGSAYHEITTVANKAIHYSNQLKKNGAKVYSIGIHEVCDPSANYDFWFVRMDSYSSWTFDNEEPIYATKAQGMNGYMHFVSSNYNYNALVGLSSSYGYDSSNMTILRWLDTKDHDDYYMSCNNASALVDIFESIGEEVTTGGADYTLTETATAVIDIVSDSFKLPDGADPSIVSVKVAPCTGVTSTGISGSYTYNFGTPVDASTLFPGISVTVEDKTVKVTGYNFSENFVGEVTYNFIQKIPHGYKLIISFPIEIDPSNPGGANVNTNAIGSGMYFDHDGDGKAEQIGGFEFPKVKIPNIVVIKKGLKPGESATFTIHKVESDGTMSQFPIVLVATQKLGAEYAIAKAKIQQPGRYMVTESTWSWAYTISGLETTYDKEDSSSISTDDWNAVGFGEAGSGYPAVIPFKFGTETTSNAIIRNVNDFTEDEKDGEYKGTLFIFTDTAKANMPAHAEAINNNEFYESK